MPLGAKSASVSNVQEGLRREVQAAKPAEGGSVKRFLLFKGVMAQGGPMIGRDPVNLLLSLAVAAVGLWLILAPVVAWLRTRWEGQRS